MRCLINNSEISLRLHSHFMCRYDGSLAAFDEYYVPPGKVKCVKIKDNEELRLSARGFGNPTFKKYKGDSEYEFVCTGNDISVSCYPPRRRTPASDNSIDGHH